MAAAAKPGALRRWRTEIFRSPIARIDGAGGKGVPRR
jgi:hypothetical protein